MRQFGEDFVTDVLLTHSYHLPYDRKQVRKMQPYPPLGTLYAASLLRQHGVSIAVFDSMLKEPESGFQEALRVHCPRIVAIYEDDFNFLTKMCLTRMREVAWGMIRAARESGARVLVHGSDASDHASEYLRHGCQYVLNGEAEYTLLQVVRELKKGLNTPQIARVLRPGGSNSRGALEDCQKRPAIPGNALPFPARDLIDLSEYRAAWKRQHGYFSMNLIASRGCPFRCNWCAKPIFGDSYQLRPAPEVAQEMRLLRDEYGAEHLWFADDIFALNRHWVEEFANAVEELACAMPFKIQARADLLTGETTRALKRAGCSEVWMGVESGSQKVLDAMDKGLRVEEVVAARQHLKDQGILACYFLQLGYPGERWDDIQKTISLVRETRPDNIGVSFSYPLPNTQFYARVREQLGAKQNWSDSEDLCVMFKGAYTDHFYRVVRDALHAEVESWHSGGLQGDKQRAIQEMWRVAEALEPVSRNPDATELSQVAAEYVFRLPPESSRLVYLQPSNSRHGEIHE
jgi:anaerobic magnesium-protoporphyrin IX monomethyl ester cyclase